MSQILHENLTLEQFLRLPETKPALEYLQGKVVQKVSPKTTHSVLQTRLVLRIAEHAIPQGLDLPYIELRCTFGGEAIVPDLCVFTKGRIPEDKHGQLVEDVFLPPDLAIEILSPGQPVRNLGAKLSRCVLHGVRLAWLIQPKPRRVFVVRPGQPIETLENGGILEGEDVLPGFSLPLSELFGWLVRR